MAVQVIPVLRIFDEAKAREFYIEWLGFSVDWEHRFHDNAPIYMQVTRGDITFHLSEHHGDASPGAKVFIEFPDLIAYHKELSEKKYKYNRPGIEDAFWGSKTMQITDPFGNNILFNLR